MRTINVQEVITRLSRKLEHLDPDTPPTAMEAQDESVFQMREMLYDLTKYYYAGIAQQEIKREENMTTEVIVACRHQREQPAGSTKYMDTYRVVVQFPQIGKQYLPEKIRIWDIGGLELTFGQATSQTLIRLNGIACPFLFDFTL